MGKWKIAHLRTKVILGFAMVITAVILAGLISYNSYNHLLQSVNNPSSTKLKLKKLNQVLADLSEAETSMRAYTITRKGSYLTTYSEFASTIHQDIDSLKLIPPIDDSQNLKIDSLRDLLDEKVSILSRFIAYKNNLGNINFSSRAIEEISTNTDSVKAITRTRTTTTTTLGAVPKIDNNEMDLIGPPKKKRRKNRSRVDLVPPVYLDPQIKTETSFITDTSFIQSDTVLGSITKILADISDEENKYQQLLQQKELDIIDGNNQIINQIRSLISQLEKEALAQSITTANQAKYITNRSTFTISLIIIICMIGGTIFIYLIFRDIQFGDYYNQQLIGAKNEAEELAKAKEAFLANMSHEIRTPLNAILGFSEQLGSTTLDNGQRSYLQALTNSSEHLLATVNDILDFSKIEAGKLRIEQLPLDLNEIIEEVIHSLQIKALEKDIILETKSEPFPSDLLGDPFRLKQILINLINNAIKFTDHGKITVSSELKENGQKIIWATIKVTDTGIGISEEKLSKIFEDFNQADISPTRRYEGTGLGLAICKKLATLLGGVIAADSKLEEGSTFTLRLPFQKGASTPVKQERPQENINTGVLYLKRILVVEDDDFNIRLIQIILKKWNIDFEVARNGREALDMITSHTYDLVLTDIQMPELSGIELAQQIRHMKDTDKSSVPIIAITANVMEDELINYLQFGIDDYLTKPFKEKELLSKLAKFFQLDLPAGESVKEVGAKEANGICSIRPLEKFTSGDQAALIKILETFLVSNQDNTRKLNSYLECKDWEKVGEIAHKMFGSYGHLESETITAPLKQIEQLTKEVYDVEPVPALVAGVTQKSYQVHNYLSDKLSELKKTHVN